MKKTNLKHTLAERNFFMLALFLVLTISCTQETKNPNAAKQAKQPTKDKITKDKIPTFLLYGELMSEGWIDEQDSTVAKRFGFTIKRVAGCEVTDELVDSVKIINQKNDLIMQSKYGKNWKQQFEKETKLQLAIPHIE